MSNNIRIRTEPGGNDKRLNVKIDQKFDFIEILSLKISQDEAYRRFCSDYGAVVGRVIINNGVGVPNAKVSIFIPIDEEDALDPEIFGLYPYEVVTDKDSDGIPYNLMPKSARGKDECYTSIGTFPSKREIQDNPEVTEIYCKYYKFTTTTNDSGDFMLFGVPTGTHYLHVDADISDIGILSQRPYDVINQGVDSKKFYSNSKFKDRTEDPNLTQLKTVSPVSVTVVPFWGDTEECEIGITRADVDLKTTIIPTAIFMGSLISDNEKNSVNKNCQARTKLGQGDELVTGEGTIQMLRYDNDGAIERFDIEGGRVIDENGTWAYQIPMNLDYIVTAEDGTLVPSEDTTRGIPTRARVRFKIDMDSTGGEGRLRTRAAYLVPHNPDNYLDSDYTFNNTSKDKFFTDLFWNKIYTVKNHLTRVQSQLFAFGAAVEQRTFVGIKDVDEGGVNNPFPFNKMDTKTNPLFVVICIIISIIVTIICIINTILIPIINIIFSVINAILKIVCKIVHSVMKLVCGFLGIFSSSKKRRCRRAACMGCTNYSGRRCDCDQVVGLVPYITLPCNDQKYAICGRSSGFPFKKTLEATVDKISLEGQNNDPEGQSSTCRDDWVFDYDRFHYIGDGDCHDDDTIPLVEDVGFLSCILLQIAEALNVFKFDFYNDWVNGTLYTFLLKYKQRRNSNKFCDIDRSYDTFIVDSCTEAPPQGTATDSESNIGIGHGVDSSERVKIREGYINRFEGELFYAAYSKHKPYKLFATDIVSLGSVFDCDWQGIPKIYPWLVETSYNAPPLLGEYTFLDTGQRVLDVSGYDSSSCGNRYTPLVGHINCLGLQTGPKQCNNIKRFSELGMGLDERRIEDGGTDRDNAITNADIENPFVRGAFVYANRQSVFAGSNIPLTYIDSATGGPYSFDYADPTYNLFRNPDQKTIWQYEDSFYFYFGLNAGKTALNKMLEKYFPPCIPEKDNDFFIQAVDIIEDDAGPSPTGEIIIDVIGGVGPYTFVWSGPTVEGVDYPLVNNTQNIDNLFVGVYNVTVTDSIGNIAEGSFVVPGPPTVACDIQTTPTSLFGSTDGEIIVGIFSGTLPYTIELYELPTNNLINTFTNVNVTSHVIGGLASGNYRVVVKDSGTPQTECEDVINVGQPEQLNITVGGRPITCFGEGNGSAFAEISGGVPPYTISWSNGSTFSSIGNLNEGTYTVTVTDSAGQSDNGSYTVTEPTEIIYSFSHTNTTCLENDDTDDVEGVPVDTGTVTVNIAGGGTPPYSITLEGGSTNQTFGPFETNSHTFTDLPYGSSEFGGIYTLTISDSDRCVIEEDVPIYRAEKKLGGELTTQPSMFGGSELKVNAIGGLARTQNEEQTGFVGSYTFKYQRQIGSGWSTEVTTSSSTYNPGTSGTFRVIIVDNNGTGGTCEFITNSVFIF